MISISKDNLDTLINAEIFADIISVSKATLEKWEKTGRLKPVSNGKAGKSYRLKDLLSFKTIYELLTSKWETEREVSPIRPYRSIELFAGAGGLAIGLERAGFSAVALNEIDHQACNTLRINRPNWNIIEGDIKNIDFRDFSNIDFISGGFPCQAFSYAGQKRGFEDTRGTLFYEFARAIVEARPKVFLGENVRGLLSHDKGRTIQTIRDAINDIGYTLVEPKVIKAMFYQVPQKRERLLMVGIRDDLVKYASFAWPAPSNNILVLRDALKAGFLYPNDVPASEGQIYPEKKAKILSQVPQGGYWRDLPYELQKEYMKGSLYLEGGKTGMARRLSWDEPSLTLTCAPAQKQTERCHPEETRPLSVREYARIQTFPDEWMFSGSISDQYKQIGNAVPVNLALAIGKSLIALLNSIEKKSVVTDALMIRPDNSNYQYVVF